MRVAITGGREFRNQARVDEVLDALHTATPFDILIHGDARGADTLAADWARRRQIPIDPYPAKWDDLDATNAVIRRHSNSVRGAGFYNAAAGTQRNIRMLLQAVPHLVVVFPGGRGTAHMRAQALRYQIPIMDVDL